MPELPEVEMTRRHLADAMTGRVVVDVSVRHPRTARHNVSPEEVEDRLSGRTPRSVGRRGKFLVISLDDGQVMIGHLGMSGRYSLDGGEEPPHTHFVARLDNGAIVRFIDPRTFGFVQVVDGDEVWETGVGRLGPDAWDDPPDFRALAARLERRSAPIKALLLDQGLLAGLGNIYADEVLFFAGVHPTTGGGELGLDGAQRILEATRRVLEEAIGAGGTTLEDLAYLLPDGSAGENLDRLAVYGRSGLPCRACGTPLQRVIVRGRSTHFCPHCQR